MKKGVLACISLACSLILSSGVASADNKQISKALIDVDVGKTATSQQYREISAEACYANAKGSLLYIRSFYSSGNLKATGSGFVISADGLAVTAAHVVSDGKSITATTADGKELAAEIVSCDAATDIAIIRLPKGTYKTLTLAVSPPEGGAVVRAMGYPIKDTFIITEGITAAPSATVNDKQRMLVTCDIVNGMSGGPVFDRFGNIVGMVSGSVRTMDGIHLSALSSELFAAVRAGLGNSKEGTK